MSLVVGGNNDTLGLLQKSTSSCFSLVVLGWSCFSFYFFHLPLSENATGVEKGDTKKTSVYNSHTEKLESFFYGSE